MSVSHTLHDWFNYTYLMITHSTPKTLILRYMPFVLLFELPLIMLVWICVLFYGWRQWRTPPLDMTEYPKWSVIITCYSEGKDVSKSIVSVLEQNYPGFIQMIVVIDGAKINKDTYQTAVALSQQYAKRTDRQIIVLPKWKRGGHVSSLNSGLKLVAHGFVMVMDGDTSCDNDVLRQATQSFTDEDVIAISGALRVRNAKYNLITRLQALEYMLSIHAGKTGLSEINVVVTISGALGMFRATFLNRVLGWDSGSAEDLDMTVRLKNFFGSRPNLKIIFNPKIVGHTDAPETWFGYFKQRLRWEGDLFYIYARKHWASFKPAQIGWVNFLIMIWSGLVLQIIFPLLMLVFLYYLVFTQTGKMVTLMMAFMYIFYLLIGIITYIEYLLIISERKRYDLTFFWCLLLLPFYTFISRLWAGISVLSEMLLRSHQDSSQAPWWVLRKSKF